jgi:hypothetical protein
MLLDEWNKKLADSGFKDAETTDKAGRRQLKQWDSCYFQQRHDFERFQSKASYYLAAYHFLHSHRFLSQTDRHIWQLHAEGYGLRVIATSLVCLGIKTNKDQVATVINRLKRALEATWKKENSLESDQA